MVFNQIMVHTSTAAEIFIIIPINDVPFDCKFTY